jgi:hypothetical protein
MRKGAADQQLALAWADTDSTCRVALVGWGADIKRKVTHADDAAVLAAAPAEVSFAPPERLNYTLAAADLMQEGVDQLVLGYSAKYGKTQGCAALMLFVVVHVIMVLLHPKSIVEMVTGGKKA